MPKTKLSMGIPKKYPPSNIPIFKQDNITNNFLTRWSYTDFSPSYQTIESSVNIGRRINNKRFITNVGINKTLKSLCIPALNWPIVIKLSIIILGSL